MERTKIFISSVQSEFAEERALLFEYLRTDALLGQMFVPFVFEKAVAKSDSAQNVYLEQVEQCDIYIGLLGEKYGNADKNGISPTEHEYNLAAKLNKTRLIFLKKSNGREEKEAEFIKKVEQQVVRKSFEDFFELKTEIYASLIRYLEEKEIIRLFPFDATFEKRATLDDISPEKVQKFVRKARIKRGFPFEETTDFREILLHLNLIEGERVTNAALLLFGKKTQKFMITSCVKCAQFYGNKTTRPIPSLHIYEGDLFELIDQAVSFVMSRIDATVGGREKSTVADVTPEIPLFAVTEAIVNAVCHRDYNSNASVQVELYNNRLEISNPGQLPYGLTLEMLRGKHNSRPANPLIAHPLYLYGSIEQVGTGTEYMVNSCIEQGLKAPEFEDGYDFTVRFWRRESIEEEVENQVSDTVKDTPKDT
ncbi:MAG: DUF4062 domain-containing protein, partial [Paludibacter sp.]|nr:DUF4062 domain-containing protein [Paludibacter sp.]